MDFPQPAPSRPIPLSNVSNTPIKYKHTLTVDQSQIVLENFISLTKNNQNKDKNDDFIYSKLNSKFKDYLTKNKIFDVRIDCQRYIERMVKVTREEIESMNQILVETKSHEKPIRISERLVTMGKRQRPNEENINIDNLRPRDISKKLWPLCKEVEQLYSDWKMNQIPVQNSEQNSNNNNNNQDIDNTNNTNNNINPANHNSTKKSIEEAKKEAVESYRSKLRQDALKLMDQRKEYHQLSLNVLNSAATLITTLSNEAEERKHERNERREVFQLLKQMLQNNLSNPQ